MNKIKVWDLPTRLFHWSLVCCFSVAFLTSESERWRDIHLQAGYAVAGLVMFRLLWGFIGNPQARFANFWPTPTKLVAYLKSIIQGQPIHYVGHNPLGAVAIFILLGLCFMTACSGWLTFYEYLDEWIAEVHEVAANSLLFMVGIHLCGVVVSSWLHQENLVGAMITGRKNQDERGQ